MNYIVVILRNLMYLTLAVVIVSCKKDGTYNDPTKDPNFPSFKNRTEISLQINTATEGTKYTVFYENPYSDEGDYIGDPSFVGYTPINQQLDVPNHVDTLYVLSRGILTKYKAGDLTLSENSKNRSRNLDQTRISFSDELLNLIDQYKFPERKYNIYEEDLFKCTDLVIDGRLTDVWVSYIGNGGHQNWNTLNGHLWFYTYPAGSTPTRENITIYGVKEGNIAKVTLSDVEAQKFQLLWEKENKKGDRIHAGQYKDVNIGFVYKGNSGIRFTTPALNDESHCTIKYSNEKSYEVNGRTTAGVIKHVKLSDETEYNILGMENRIPGEKERYDGDYNDMLCLIESNPVIFPEEDIEDPDAMRAQTKNSGIYIFEDNYPSKGDYDFNDVVIKYEYTIYNDNGDGAVDLEVLATGSTFKNSFGFINGKEEIVAFENLQGRVNVSKQGAYQSIAKFKKLIPNFKNWKIFLNNGMRYIYEDSYTNPTYPYVLDVPYEFKWCMESKPIDSAYPNYTKWVESKCQDHKDWYMTPADLNLVYTNKTE